MASLCRAWRNPEIVPLLSKRDEGKDVFVEFVVRCTQTVLCPGGHMRGKSLLEKKKKLPRITSDLSVCIYTSISEYQDIRISVIPDFSELGTPALQTERMHDSLAGSL